MATIDSTNDARAWRSGRARIEARRAPQNDGAPRGRKVAQGLRERLA